MRKVARARFLHVLLLALALSVASNSTAVAPPDYCDKGLMDQGSNPLSYRYRGDRCEGLISGVVQSAPVLLKLVSITLGRPQGNPQEGQALVATWNKQSALGPTRLRAVSTKYRRYYQMDTEVIEGQNRFTWPAKIPSEDGLSLADLGVLAWSDRSDWNRRVYIPMHLRPSGTVKPTESQNQVLASFRCLVDLSHLHLALMLLDANGAPTRYLFDRDLTMESSAGEVFTVQLPLTGATTYVRVELSARSEF